MPNHSKDERLTRQIGDRMRSARIDSRLSQADAAAHLGVPPRTLRSWENGEVNQPAWCVAQMSKLYGVSADYLLSPEGTFFALIDKGAEEEAKQLAASGDLTGHADTCRILTVLVTQRLQPVTSRADWERRVAEVESAAPKPRGSRE